MREDDLNIVLELAMLANPHVKRERYREHVADELKENPDLAFVVLLVKKLLATCRGIREAP